MCGMCLRRGCVWGVSEEGMCVECVWGGVCVWGVCGMCLRRGCVGCV